MNEGTYTTEQQVSKRARRQKSTSVRLADKTNQLAKAKEKQVALQQKIKVLEETIQELEQKRRQELLQERGISSLSDLEAFLEKHDDKIGGDA
ncbi:MAG: hypothetical protein HUJ62_00045 [Streptococcus gallolyticus]|nr:hypothetical protein [Streptococcus gallolyticus]